jgi:hypothetical protein
MENDEITVDVQDETQGNETETNEEVVVDDSAAQLKKAQDEAAKWRRLAEKQNKPKPHISERETPKPSDILKSDEFRLHRMGYNEDEIDLIMHNGGAKLLENEKSPIVMGLQRAKEQRKAEDAAGETNTGAGLSEIERKYTEQDLRNMSVAELEKILPHAN